MYSLQFFTNPTHQRMYLGFKVHFNLQDYILELITYVRVKRNNQINDATQIFVQLRVLHM